MRDHRHDPNPAGKADLELTRHLYEAHRTKVRRPRKLELERQRRKAAKVARRTNRGQR